MKNKSKFALLLWGAAAFFSSATAQASPQQNIAGDRVFDSRVEQHVVSKAAPAQNAPGKNTESPHFVYSGHRENHTNHTALVFIAAGLSKY